MVTIKDREAKRKLRHRRIRKDLRGTPRRPRLFVYKSNRHIYAQVIDDFKGEVLVAASTLDSDIRDQVDNSNIQAAKLVGELVAERALDEGIDQVVFDRGGYPYHGKVKALAEKARGEGLEF